MISLKDDCTVLGISICDLIYIALNLSNEPSFCAVALLIFYNHYLLYSHGLSTQEYHYTYPCFEYIFSLLFFPPP